MTLRPQQIRNLAIVGHKGAGKTALVEAMLYVARAAPTLATGLCDDTPEERTHAATLESRLLRLQWGETYLNVIDTPGEATLHAEAQMALAAADAALLVISASGGIESSTERAFQWIHEAHLPCLAVLTKVDEEGARLEEVVAAAD